MIRGRRLLCESALTSRQAAVIVIDKCNWRVRSWGLHSSGHSPQCRLQVIARRMQSILITISVTRIRLFSVKIFCFAQRPTSASRRPSDVVHPTVFFQFVSSFPSPPLSPPTPIVHALSRLFLEKQTVNMVNGCYFLCLDFRSLLGLNKLYLNESYLSLVFQGAN